MIDPDKARRGKEMTQLAYQLGNYAARLRPIGSDLEAEVWGGLAQSAARTGVTLLERAGI